MYVLRVETVDGAVDPSDSTGYTGKDTVYTIVLMNLVHKEMHGEMMDENQFPDPLKAIAKYSLTAEGRKHQK